MWSSHTAHPHSYKEITELAGYTYRVTDMLQVFDSVAAGRYSRGVDADTGAVLSGGGAAAEATRALLQARGTRQLSNDGSIEFDDVPIVSPIGDTLVKHLNFCITRGSSDPTTSLLLASSARVAPAHPVLWLWSRHAHADYGAQWLWEEQSVPYPWRLVAAAWWSTAYTRPVRHLLRPSEAVRDMAQPSMQLLCALYTDSCVCGVAQHGRYLCLGTLREQIIYPDTKEDMQKRGFTDRELDSIMDQVH